LHISKICLKELPIHSKILDVGCGPCDLTAIIAKLGYDVVGCDDLSDSWHLIGNNRERIVDFAQKMGIKLMVESIERAKLEQDSFDAVLMIDLLEHHTSPRQLLNLALTLLKPNGLLLIETPNSAMLAKRLLLLCGKSNYPDVNFVFFNVGAYRGHVREYTISEIKLLLKFIGLNKIKVKTTNHSIYELLMKQRGMRRALFRAYYVVSNLYLSFRSTIIAYGRKPQSWHPVNDLKAIEQLKKYYPHIVEYNLNNEFDEVIIEKLRQQVFNESYARALGKDTQ